MFIKFKDYNNEQFFSIDSSEIKRVNDVSSEETNLSELVTNQGDIIVYGGFIAITDILKGDKEQENSAPE